MAKLALLIALIALVLAFLAYQRAGGTQDVQLQIQSLQRAVEVAREETANALGRLEKVLRPSEGRQ